MAEYLRDKALTAERIEQLRVSLEFAEYELSAAVHLAQTLGMSWAELAGPLGMTRQGASQWAKRHSQGWTPGLDDAERDRIGRLIGVGQRVVRYQVRVITSGKPGVSRVTRATLSTHLKLDVAARHCRERGADAELWKVWPDGTEQQLRVPPERPRHRPPMGAPPSAALVDETPF